MTYTVPPINLHNHKLFMSYVLAYMLYNAKGK